MSSFNIGSIAKNQQWRNDLLMKPSDPVQKPTNEVFKELPQPKYPGHAGHSGQQCHHGRPGHVSHSAPPGHLVPPSRPSHAGHSGHGHPGHSGHGHAGHSGHGHAGHLGHGHAGHSGHGHAGHSSHGQACNPGHANHGGQAGQRGRQVLTNASVCCEQPNCNRAKIEQMPEHYFQEPATPFTLMNPAQGRDPQPGKKEPSAPPSDHDYMYCPCGRGGQLVTICCTGRNCDNSTKIDEGIHMGPPEVHMCHPEVHMCSPDAQMGSPNAQMGSPDAFKGPEEKRARTSYNQYKY